MSIIASPVLGGNITDPPDASSPVALDHHGLAPTGMVPWTRTYHVHPDTIPG